MLTRIFLCHVLFSHSQISKNWLIKFRKHSLPFCLPVLLAIIAIANITHTIAIFVSFFFAYILLCFILRFIPLTQSFFYKFCDELACYFVCLSVCFLILPIWVINLLNWVIYALWFCFHLFTYALHSFFAIFIFSFFDIFHYLLNLF